MVACLCDAGQYSKWGKLIEKMATHLKSRYPGKKIMFEVGPGQLREQSVSGIVADMPFRRSGMNRTVASGHQALPVTRQTRPSSNRPTSNCTNKQQMH